ncbi:hypothetical protein BT69DRAFT_1286476 [Atractiella rhizophila]|nr:hypothetical protein BT69DRAFT_1286476 [Atractiella rhizophila]
MNRPESFPVGIKEEIASQGGNYVHITSEDRKGELIAMSDALEKQRGNVLCGSDVSLISG